MQFGPRASRAENMGLVLVVMADHIVIPGERQRETEAKETERETQRERERDADQQWSVDKS